MRRLTRFAVVAAAAAVTLLAVAAIQAGNGPGLVWSEGTLDFGSMAAGEAASHTFTLSADHGQLTDIDVAITGSGFTITDDQCSGLKTRIAAKHDRTCDVTVAYSPASADDTGTLTATADKPDSSSSVSLTGSGLLHFSAPLSPLSENPPHPESHASGTANVAWDTTTSMMTVDVTFADLTTPNTASHIHCCIASPGNAGVATTTPTFTGFPTGAQSGTYHHTFDMNDAASYNTNPTTGFIVTHGGTVASAKAALLAGMRAGQSYLNVHTQMFGGGEIRGFLQPS
jgi:hypothetical protein